MGIEDLHRDSLDNYLSIVDAARYMSKCTKTIRGYIDNGVLRARKFKGQGRTLWVKRGDLEALATMGKEKLRTVDIWDLLRTVKVRLRGIENRLDFLMRIGGLDVSLLRDADIDVLLSAYNEARQFLKVNHQLVPYDGMAQWAEIILQFSEIEYQRIVGPTMDAKPWKVFHELCLSLMKSLRRKKGFASHPRMQETYRMLEKARKQVSQSAVILEETRAYKLGPKQVFKIADLGRTEDSLDRYIAAEAQRSVPR